MMRRTLVNVSTLLFAIAAGSAACDSPDPTGCEVGDAGCECAAGTCMPGLECGADNVCMFVEDDDDDKADDAVTESGDTGAGDDGAAAAEERLCLRADECNALGAGISTQDCGDLIGMCTDGMVSSAYTDWAQSVEVCLAYANCGNYLDCLAALPECSPIESGEDLSCGEGDLGEATGYAVASGTTVDEDEDLAQSCASGGAADSTLTWTAPASGTFMLDTDGSTYDTALAVYTDCDASHELVCNDDGGSGTTSSLTLAATAGETYVVAISGFSGATGSWVLNIH